MERLNGLDLFSGIGGITLALGDWVRPVAYCEQDRYAVGGLLSRMVEGRIPRAPIWDDVRTLQGNLLPVKPDIIYGGFPCQDISVAGAGAGLEGQRSGLFFEIVRLAKEIKPAFIFLENVTAIRTRGLDRVIQELTQVGYDCRWTMLSAAEVGANHKRERWFLLAHTISADGRNGTDAGRGADERWAGPSEEPEGLQSKVGQTYTGDVKPSGDAVADPERPRLEGNLQPTEQPSEPRGVKAGWWAVEPNVGRVAHGIPNRVDRLKCLGNAVVPEQAKTAFEILIGLKAA